MRILRPGCGLVVGIQSLSAPRSSLSTSSMHQCWEQSPLLSDSGPFSWHYQLEGALTGIGNTRIVMVTASIVKCLSPSLP